MDATPWPKKYAPSTVAEIKGQDKAIRELTSYVENFSAKRPRAAMLHGPPGTGKTCAVYALANDQNLEIVEVNASDTRNSSSLEPLLSSVVGQQSLFGVGKIVLVDEIDGLSGRKDRGGVPTLIKILAKSAFPIILTANNPWNKKFSALRRKCQMIQFDPVDHRSVAAVLRKVAEEEGIKYTTEALERLGRVSGGDIRAAIQDLHLLSVTTGSLTQEDLDRIDARSQKESLPSALPKIFKTTDLQIAWHAFDSIEENLDECLLWIEENLPQEYVNVLDLHRGFASISRANIYKGRIRRGQHWRLLVYIRAMLTIGVALAKDEKYRGSVKYVRPKRILEIWKANRANALRNAICERIAEETHTSTRAARLHTLPYLLHMSRTRGGTELAESLGLSADEVAWLQRR